MFLSFLAEEASWVFDLGAYEIVWDIIFQISIILMALFLGNALRNVIPFLKKSLIPSAIIGGLILLIIKIILTQCGVNEIDWVWNANWAEKKGVALSTAHITFINNNTLQVITYHCLAIGFIAQTFRTTKNKQKTPGIKVLENGLLTGGAYMLQAWTGLLITIIWYLLTKNSNDPIFYSSGVILPLGFGQGPGNALTWDKIYSEAYTMFTGNGSFGLTIASVGFIVASLFGVLYINIQKKKGTITIREFDPNAVDLSDYVGENEIPETESIDKFSVQLGFVAIAYALSYIIMVAFSQISKFTNSIAWGFNFIWGVITATLIKQILKLLKKTKAVNRNYINNHQMDRISGFAFDLMIVAGVGAIQIEFIKKYIWVLIVLCVVGTISTYFYVKAVSKKCFKGYEHEVFVMNFGTVTGTASNGMILLKEIDPNFETPTNRIFILSQFPAMLFVAPILLLLNFTGESLKSAIIACAIFFILFLGYTIFLFRKRKNDSQSDIIE